MSHVDFTIVHKHGEVTIVRNKTAAQKRAAIEGKSMKVHCFDSKQIDRIFRYQEIESSRNQPQKEFSINKFFKL